MPSRPALYPGDVRVGLARVAGGGAEGGGVDPDCRVEAAGFAWRVQESVAVRRGDAGGELCVGVRTSFRLGSELTWQPESNSSWHDEKL